MNVRSRAVWAVAVSAVLSLLTVLAAANVSEQRSSNQDELTAAESRFFEQRVRPLLIKHCYRCHSENSGRMRGGLRLDTKEGLLRGGQSGPSIVPHDSEVSVLISAIEYDDAFLQMPPNGKLDPAEIAILRAWVEMGAPDPRVENRIAHQPQHAAIDIDAGRAHWAYQPLAANSPDDISASNWARTPIDQLVDAERDALELRPVSDADARTLVRRMHLVITGLPPAPEQLRRWVSTIELAASETARHEAVEDLVDTLLATEQFGERWGRHWLDVARFAESTGGDHNNIYQHAWRYRNFVIDAFNDDVPFDHFIRQQIAGDLLPIADNAEWANNIVATGFLAIGPKLVGEENQPKFLADLVDDQIGTTTRAFLATTVSCARCHDHKYDAIPQTDYYAMAGIFRATETHYGLLPAQARQSTTLIDLTDLVEPEGDGLTPAEYQQLVDARESAKRELDEAMQQIRSGENVFRGTLRRLRSQRDETSAALQAYLPDGQRRAFAMGTQDRDAPLTTHLLVRGEVDQRAQQVHRGLPQVLTERGRNRLPSQLRSSGRLQLADWIASAHNPLTARVIVNRIWHWMFGRGLVRTVDDFGKGGEAPTHAALLDYLAGRLVESDWSVKSIIREIALSRTFQLSSNHSDEGFAIDPENAYLWQFKKRRLEAEAIRDAMLAVSGELDLTRPSGTLLQSVGEGGVGQNVFEPDIRAIEANVRSVYLPRVRSVLPHVLELFDAPDASLVTGARDTTSNPLQSLYMMNNPFVQSRAAALAGRVNGLDANDQITALYELFFSRTPTDNERAAGLEFLRSGSTREQVAIYCQTLLCTSEFMLIE